MVIEGLSPYRGFTHVWITSCFRYRPNDLDPGAVQSTLMRARESSTNPDNLVAVFKKIRERFKPVMRHFFTEKHKNSAQWFSSRTNYSRSVAVNSIVGHLLGLGDRHISNILLDLVTGEVIHIDLGIAFEQVRLTVITRLAPNSIAATA